MSRKIFALVLSALLFALCVPVSAQQAKKVFRIGYLGSLDPTSESARAEAIRLALRDLGYIEGQNIAIEYRYTERKVDRAPKLVAELVALPCDVIVVTGGGGWIRAAMNATKTIPIVMTGVGLDPVDSGIVKSLSRPGGNITGITNLSGKLGAKRLELFKEAVPELVRVAVLYDRTNQGAGIEVKEILPVTARTLKVTLQPWEVREADGFEKAFAAINKGRPDGLYVPPSGPLIAANGKRIADFALKSRLASMYQSRENVDAGGLMSYGTDPADSYRRVAVYVDRILKGARPADLPVEQPTKFELVINNLKTAKQLGLTIPQKVLARADKVIR